MSSNSFPRTFPADGPIAASISNGNGDVVITAADVPELTVDLRPGSAGDPDGLELVERATVAYHAGSLRIEIPERRGLQLSFGRGPSVDVFVTVPAGSTISTKTGSGDVRTDGQLGSVDAEAGSGDVSIDACGDARLRAGSGALLVGAAASVTARTGSGDVRIERADGDVDVEVGSGDVELGTTAGDVRVTAASGDVRLDSMGGEVRLRTASGDIDVRRVVEGDLRTRSASGDIVIGIAEGTAAQLDVSSISGRVRSELEHTDAPADTDRTAVVTSQSVSGSITLIRTH
jgi:DUF4097 and DUF4098 domain-containing protein YvlB